MSLVPFACIAIAAGALRVGRGIGRPRVVAALTLLLLASTTAWHLRRTATMATAWESGLQTREAELMRLAR